MISKSVAIAVVISFAFDVSYSREEFTVSEDVNRRAQLNFCPTLGSFIPPPDSTCWKWNTVKQFGEQKGCDDVPCQEAVCACDPYCCTESWDLSCRGYSKDPSKPKDNPVTPGCSSSILCCEPFDASVNQHSGEPEQQNSEEQIQYRGPPYNVDPNKEMKTSSVVSCPSDSSVMGYIDYNSLVKDMAQDAATYKNGNYGGFEPTYVICPNAELNVDYEVGIVPLLDNTVIKCGANGSRKDNCVIKGGKNHVVFRPDVTVKNVEFHGITMIGSTKASVTGWSPSPSSATFVDCHWRNNEGSDIIDLWMDNDDYSRRMQVEGARRTEGSEIGAMSIEFNDCKFTDNKAETGIILVVRGYARLINCIFASNETKGVIIGASLGSKVHIDAATSFVYNTGSFSTVFSDATSSLTVSTEATGTSNKGEVCNDVFYEKIGSSCLSKGGYLLSCYGKCCNFGEADCFVEE